MKKHHCKRPSRCLKCRQMKKLAELFSWQMSADHCSPISTLRAQLMGGHLTQNIVQS